jgi:flagellar basal body-associated protein FliL
MNKIILSLLVLLGGAAIGVYVWQQGKTPAVQTGSAAETAPPVFAAAPEASVQPQEPEPVQAAPAPPHHPVDASLQAAATALPALDASDKTIRNDLVELFGKTAVQQLLQPQEIVRRIVVTIDNLPRSKAAARLLPLKKVDGSLLTEGAPGSMTIAAHNAKRYAPYVYLADLTDASQLVALYAHYYPLFQRAYQELGYPDGYFNDRLILVIDHLLETPDSTAPLALSQPHVLYEFADPALESRSAGQKILLRIGSANAGRIKAKLREIRAVLIAQMPAQTRKSAG